MLDVKLGIHDMHVKLKAQPNEPLVVGKWCKKIHVDEALWSIERDGGPTRGNTGRLSGSSAFAFRSEGGGVS